MRFADTQTFAPMNPAEVAHAWVQGWVLSRQTPAAIDHGTYLTIPVGLPGHTIRHVLPTLDMKTLESLINENCVSGTWLKIVAPQEAVKPLLSSNWEVDEREYLMHTRLGTNRYASNAHKVNFDHRGSVITATLLAPNGDEVVRAKAAIVGSTAIFDQVVTTPQHRRKGYGSVLMSRLATECESNGATVGILVATEEGRLLYSALGWEIISEVTAIEYIAK